MERGIWEEISASERRNHATFFAARDRRNLRGVEFFSGKYARDTGFSRIKKLLDDSAGKLRIKVCGPAVFHGRLIGVEKIGGNNWGQRGDPYLKTEITADRFYCYSWVANYRDKDAKCISFEILKEKKKKK
jgi:hypothetical protein